MPTDHNKLFTAIVLSGAAFGANGCYLSHERGVEGGLADAGRDGGRDATIIFPTDAGHDSGIDADVECPAPMDCEACGTFCFTATCECESFCCFI